MIPTKKLGKSAFRNGLSTDNPAYTCPYQYELQLVPRNLTKAVLV